MTTIKDMRHAGKYQRGLTIASVLMLSLLVALFAAVPAFSEPCEQAVHRFNGELTQKIDEAELVAILRSLNDSGNRRLPEKFVTKQEARRVGWHPGGDLWGISALKGKSIGGDAFKNREGKLPGKGRAWREADLAYRGGHRGSKRIVYSNDGLRMVTVDHYATFRTIPACQ